MKAQVSRLSRGEYFAVFSISSGSGAIGFIIEGSDKNWILSNKKGTELNQWTSKKSMIDYLESKTETQLIELANK